MRNIIKLLGIIALVAVIGLSMAGCELEPEESEKAVVVTSISSTYNGKYGYVALVDSIASADIVAISLPVKVSSGSFKGELYDAKKSTGTSYKKFTGEGSYYVMLIISNDSGGQDDVFDGITSSKVSIKDGTTSMTFTQFASNSPPVGPTNGTLKITNETMVMTDTITNVRIRKGSSSGDMVQNDTVSIAPNGSKEYSLEAGSYYVQIATSMAFSDDVTVTITAGQTKTVALTDTDFVGRTAARTLRLIQY
jgi:hypothetical protein